MEDTLSSSLFKVLRLLTKSVTQVFTVYTQHGAETEDLAFIALYSPLAQPLMVTFYLLTIVCVVRPASDWSTRSILSSDWPGLRV